MINWREFKGSFQSECWLHVRNYIPQGDTILFKVFPMDNKHFIQSHLIIVFFMSFYKFNLRSSSCMFCYLFHSFKIIVLVILTHSCIVVLFSTYKERIFISPLSHFSHDSRKCHQNGHILKDHPTNTIENSKKLEAVEPHFVIIFGN